MMIKRVRESRPKGTRTHKLTPTDQQLLKESFAMQRNKNIISRQYIHALPKNKT